ncbi:NAD-dependent epimerase/dehydratase family protein [Pasteurella skyensis]|uniref:NAD-dependent epimerase/dehydratase family protein n=1 Tax=Phocoenobacter skyensis TaxID=97481 RepID=A0AAJ6P0V5_9PAST|nr:NAD-dependent epimerase/dehydratase family protein [Pasteurella skyensis]MDP8162121.1 NAD-dependent epimerase/dehydratase family protein [Pasteurella skyensis]MDP8172980.1 NAD-dependent epimerase/dehydratase family protein [Pasteurella skyensis]MDP8176747.1 NAD-dependent epimerase/dehydratase family protein [Pasteurella skyensis]MDP8179495.1 NAD-dependent epimerase/dehydratase family protein [Pasteurella skyensis]MDP8183651.1 NAD-dependent epimerase/dehydratase family protein [Pasteurella s
MKIIITGASGFVGSNLSADLGDKGNKIEKVSLRNENFTFDKGADVIIHLAGKAHDTSNTSEENEYFKVNTDLTIKVFDEFLNSDIKDFFLFSSVKAVADGVEGFLREDYIATPKTPYGKSKLKAEEYLLSKELPQGKRLFIIRPTMIHGEGNKGNLNLLHKIVNKGIPWPLASFKNERSFLSMDNLNYVISEMLNNKEIASGIYHLADDETISTNQLIKIIANTSGKKTRLWKIPVNLIKFVAKIGDRLGLPLNSERLQKLTENYAVSNKKIKQALGIEKLPLTAEEGLIKTIKSFKE